MTRLEDIKESIDELEQELSASYAQSSPLRKLLELIRLLTAELEGKA